MLADSKEEALAEEVAEEVAAANYAMYRTVPYKLEMLGKVAAPSPTSHTKNSTIDYTF